jgi:hypothetical protein
VRHAALDDRVGHRAHLVDRKLEVRTGRSITGGRLGTGFEPRRT